MLCMQYYGDWPHGLLDLDITSRCTVLYRAVVFLCVVCQELNLYRDICKMLCMQYYGDWPHGLLDLDITSRCTVPYRAVVFLLVVCQE